MLCILFYNGWHKYLDRHCIRMSYPQLLPLRTQLMQCWIFNSILSGFIQRRLGANKFLILLQRNNGRSQWILLWIAIAYYSISHETQTHEKMKTTYLHSHLSKHTFRENYNISSVQITINHTSNLKPISQFWLERKIIVKSSSHLLKLIINYF